MDIQLARTFLEIIAAGNFVSAAKRLFVTQSAISLRVRKLEEELGRELFVRSKSGIELTPAGEQFERYARSIVKVWEDARYHVAVPEGFDDTLIIGGEYSLWTKLGTFWLWALEEKLPRIAFRAELGMHDRLMQLMHDGLLDIGIMYTPQLRPGLEVEPLIEDNLILVSTEPDTGPALDDRYVYMDWGPEFAALHALRFPKFRTSRTTLRLGALAVNYVIRHDRTAYFPARVVRDRVEKGELHVVADAPVFPFPSYVVWNTDKDEKLIQRSLRLLQKVAAKADDLQQQTLEEAGIFDENGNDG